MHGPRVLRRRLGAIAVVLAIAVAGCSMPQTPRDGTVSGISTPTVTSPSESSETVGETAEVSSCYLVPQLIEAGTPGRTLRLVSTSGMPHTDIGDLQRSRFWEPGMPTGATAQWERHLRDVIDVMTEDADVVLHQGDQVEGRWGRDRDGAGVFGRVDKRWQQRRAIREAGRVYYTWLNRLWGDTRVLWGLGDHEIGDLKQPLPKRPGNFVYANHRTFVEVWRRYHDTPPQYATKVRNVGIVTLNPFERTRRALRVHLSDKDIRWMRREIKDLRRRGADWILVQSEIPLIGPNFQNGTSGLMIDDGRRVWNELRRLDVDLFLGAEFHAPTTYTDDDHTPMHIVHGRAGGGGNASYLAIDVHDGRDARLELSMINMYGTNEAGERIWSTGRRPGKRVRSAPHLTTERHLIGRATVVPDGRVLRRAGVLDEGPQGKPCEVPPDPDRQ